MEGYKIIFEGKEYGIGANESVKDFIQKNSLTKKIPAAAILNGTMFRLDKTVQANSTLEIVDLDSPHGRKIYENSIIFLFLVAFHKLFSSRKVFIQHSIQHGIYVEVDEDELQQAEIEKISGEIMEMAKKKMPISRKTHDWHLYQSKLEANDRTDLLRLFQYSANSEFKVYELEGFEEYFDLPIMPTTEHLEKFQLLKYQQGLVIVLPSADGKIPKFEDKPKLFNSFQEFRTWSRLLKIRTAGQLNDYIMNEEAADLIKVSEALHEKKIANIADQITKQEHMPRLILIAGPSSSGKTTFSKRLGIQLQVNGYRPFTISMDNYFIDREKTPKDENGNYNFESIDAIDISLFMDQINKLLSGDEVEIPRFDFVTGKRKASNPANRIRLKNDQFIIVEGIHGLNPKLTSRIDDKSKFKIYIAPLTQLNLHRHGRIPASDTRLLRRLVRDSLYRGYSASDTLKQWDSVREGEKQNIFPLQEEADVIFNSALFYELSILKDQAKKELLKVKKNDPSYIEAIRLIRFLSHFIRMDADDVPTNSILKEFIGGSSFEY